MSDRVTGLVGPLVRPLVGPLVGEATGTGVSYLLDDVPGALLASASWQISSTPPTKARKILAVGGVNDGTEAEFSYSELADGTVDAWLGAGVGYVTADYDQSGNVVDLTPVSASARPTHNSGTTAPFMSFDGVDDALTNASLDLSGNSDVTIILAAKLKDRTGLETLFCHGANANSAGIEVFQSLSTAGAIAAGYNTSTFREMLVTQSGALPAVIVTTFRSGVTGQDARLNGGEFGTRSVAGSSVFGASHMVDRPVYIGARGGTTLEAFMEVYAVLVYPRVLSASELAIIEAELGEKCGADIAPTAYANGGTVTAWEDSAAPVDRTTHYEVSPFASFLVDTDADVLETEVYRDIASSFDAGADVGVFVDGSFYTRLLAGNRTGALKRHVFLPSGAKRVELRNGLTSRPAADVLGTWLVSAKGDGSSWSVPSITPTNRILIYGDSITAGWNASDGGTVTEDGYPVLVRDAVTAPDSVAVEAYGYRRLNHDAATAGAVTAFVAKLATYSPSIIWMSIGTNDYASAFLDAADFGTMYGDVLDEIDSVIPAATVYCMSPLVRTDEGANGFGDTLQDYRDAIQTACASRAWANFVNGATIITTGDLSDNVHPDAGGMVKVANQIISTLGL